MGVCKKCRKISPFFCYHCRSTVCYDCITDLEHRIAPVVLFEKYLLNPSDCEAMCPMTGALITEKDEVIRFMNMQLFLISSIDEYGSQKSFSVSEVNDFTIPGSEEPMLPPPGDKSKLAQEIRTKLSHFKWFNEKSNSTAVLSDPVYVSRAPVIPTHVTTPAFISPRKPTSSDVVIDLEEADDPQGKNRQKKKISEMISSASNYIKLNANTVIVLGLFCSMLILFIFLFFNMMNNDNLEQENPILSQTHTEQS